MNKLEKGDVVQITNENHHWFPAMIVVDEVKSFGIQGYTIIVNNNQEQENGCAYIRLEEKDYTYIGKAVVYYE